jgi:F-box protein 21
MDLILQVLQSKEGIPITLCIVYHEIAKRLGVNCEPVGFPQHFLLKWKEFPESVNTALTEGSSC